MSTIDGMVIFCTGSARRKREYFKKRDNVLLLDNIEVLFCASENGRNYFAYGKVPFANFTVIDYLRYRCALCGKTPTENDVKAFGLSPKSRIGRLAFAERRCVTLIEKSEMTNGKDVVVNLDGAKYSKKNGAALNRLLSNCSGDVYVCITDNRFEKKTKRTHKTLAFGCPQSKRKRPEFYAAKKLARMIDATRVAVF